MLMKLTPRVVDFTNILQTDPKSTKNTVELSVFFALLGSAHAKASLRMLMKLTLDRYLRRATQNKL